MLYTGYIHRVRPFVVEGSPNLSRLEHKLSECEHECQLQRSLESMDERELLIVWFYRMWDSIPQDEQSDFGVDGVPNVPSIPIWD